MAHVIKIGDRYISTDGSLTDDQSSALRVDLSDAPRSTSDSADTANGPRLPVRTVRLRPRASRPAADHGTLELDI